MKSVGIITFQWFDNYGSVLQAYALQETIKNLGYDARIVPLKTHYLEGLRRYISLSLSGQIEKIKSILWEQGGKRHSKYQEFRRLFFNYSKRSECYFEDVLKDRLKEDVLVFGSDNIWGPWVVHLDDIPMSGLFYGDKIEHPCKIVYAASTGAHIELHPQYKEALSRIRNANFKAISLREKANVKIFEEERVSAVHVPDPSLLLLASDWQKIEDPSIVPGHPYVFGYELGHTSEITIRTGCEMIAKADNKKVQIAYPKAFFANRDVACYPNPSQWLALIHYASAVVTDSFHGVMFSLIYHRPFLFLRVTDEGGIPNMRAFEILKFVGLEDRIVNGCVDEFSVCEQMGRLIDWNQVDARLKAFRDKGYDFLKGALV